MKVEEDMWKLIQQHLGYSNDEMNLFRSNPKNVDIIIKGVLQSFSIYFMMTKNIKIKTIVILGIFLILCGYYFLYHSEFMKIDSCLDAGGQWLKSENKCVFQ